MAHESIFLVRVVPKQYPDSYRYIAEGRPGNPRSIHPKNFKTKGSFKMEIGSASLIEQEDWQTLEILRELARYRGLQGTYQVRQNFGALGGKQLRKMKYRAGLISARCGTRVLLRDFEV